MAQPIPTPYEDLLAEVLASGRRRADRTGTGTIGVFGRQIRYDLAEGFPLLTTKRMFTRGVFAELLWILDGDTNEHTLRDQGVNIWREWAAEDGDLGPIYGAMWRSWPGRDGKSVDQISQVVNSLRHNPFSRRHVVSAWNPAVLDEVALPPCHAMFQFHVDPDEQGNPERLNLQLYQRSADLFLGVPVNIASYSALLMMVAQQVGLEAGEFVHAFGDAHIYLDHLDQVREQLSREPRPYPTLTIAGRTSLFDHRLEDFVIEGYDPHPTIKAPVSV